MRTRGFMALGGDGEGAAAKPGLPQFRRGDIGDGEGGMSGGGAQRVAPGGTGGRSGAAIDDQPVFADREFERTSAGMGETVQPGGGRGAGIGNDQAFAGGETEEAGVAEFDAVAGAAAGLAEGEVDQGWLVFFRPVEQSQAAIAVPQ